MPPTLGLALAQKNAGHDVWLAHDQKRGAFNAFEEAAQAHIDAADISPPVKLTLSNKSSLREIFVDRRALKNLCKEQI